MEQEHIAIAKLIRKYPDFTAQEKEVWEAWIGRGNNERIWKSISDEQTILSELEIIQRLAAQVSVSRQKLADRFGVEMTAPRKSNTPIIRYLAAAVTIGVIATAGYIFYERTNNPSDNATSEARALIHEKVEPGKNKARLTLADGRVIILDNAKGKLASQAGTAVSNTDGQLTYEKGTDKSRESVYNTLVTEYGETYQLLLSDGSKIWLNAGSSVRFPVNFDKQERKVEITGEAFLQVAKDAKRPFITKVGKTEIKVLGTAFNVNAYEEIGGVATTLVEGKVQVSHADGATKIMKPGENALSANNGKITFNPHANIDQVTAWKSGLFIFNGEKLSVVMKQLERWYNVQVIYKGSAPATTFYGIMGRELPLEQVLTALRKNNVQLQVEGNKIIVGQ